MLVYDMLITSFSKEILILLFALRLLFRCFLLRLLLPRYISAPSLFCDENSEKKEKLDAIKSFALYGGCC